MTGEVPRGGCTHRMSATPESWEHDAAVARPCPAGATKKGRGGGNLDDYSKRRGASVQGDVQALDIALGIGRRSIPFSAFAART